MSFNETPAAGRVHIGFFGRRNAGKSSLVNAFCSQQLSVVSDVLGTTTDPVLKSMELLPLGPVVIIDTPGYDDEGELGSLRVKKTKEVIDKADIAILVVSACEGLKEADKELLELFKKRNTDYIIAYNKCDIAKRGELKENEIYVSAKTGENIELLKNTVARLTRKNENDKRIVGDLIKEGQTVICVTPIDSAAPKGRLILPQQLVIRDIIDSGAICVVTRETELKKTLLSLKEKPALVITDSQAFKIVSDIVPKDIKLTSFSILMARYKGFLETAVKGVYAIKTLKDEDTVIISEGCTHHRQCDDIGTVKLPKWLCGYTGKKLNIKFTSGREFPYDFKETKLVIHCGGCMLNEKEMKSRMERALDAGVPFTNYGTAIALFTGILERSLSPLEILAEDK